MEKRTYRVRAKFAGQVHGGIPANHKMLISFCEFKQMNEAQIKEMTDTAPIPAPEETPEVIEKSRTSFRQDETGLFLAAHQVKKCMEEAAQSAGMWKREKGDVGSLKQIMQHACQVLPKNIYLYAAGSSEPLKEPTGIHENRAKISGPSGSRSIIKFADYVEDAEFAFEVHLFEKDSRILTEAKFLEIVERMTVAGLGANRPLGNGRFEIIGVEKEIKPSKKIEFVKV